MPILANPTADMLPTQTPWVPTKGEPNPPQAQTHTDPNAPQVLDQRGFDARLDDFMAKNPSFFNKESTPNTQQQSETAKVVQEIEANQNQSQTQDQETVERKALIKSDKERRALKQQAKSAKDKAAAYDKIMEAANGEDPTALITEAGLDPKAYFDKVVKHSQKDTAPKDPVQKAKEELLAEFNQREQEREVKFQKQADQLAMEQSISTSILPMLMTQPDRFETVLAMHNGNGKKAAEYVFNTAFEHYKETGTPVTFDQIADNLEKYHWDAVEAGHNATIKLKKFIAKYGSGSTPQPQQQQTNRANDNASIAAKYETPAQPVPQQQTSWARSPFEVPSQEDRMNDALKRAGLGGR